MSLLSSIINRKEIYSYLNNIRPQKTEQCLFFATKSVRLSEIEQKPFPPEITTSQTEQCLFGLLNPRSCLPPKVCYIRNGIKQKLSSDRNGTVQKLSSDRNYLRRLLSNYAKLRVGNPTQKKEHSPFFADRLATLGVCLIPLTRRGLPRYAPAPA